YERGQTSALLDEDEPRLEGIVLPMTDGVELEVPVLILCDHLKPVLEGEVHVGSDRPLRIEPRGIGMEPVVTDSGRHLLAHEEHAVRERALAVELREVRSGVA